ncbi:hypothetical protein D9758_001020 [Tetrapyrgos nigripes]|uniref:Origin recognition complex subunit 4 n=1 Tax=Tetrapyrgos nigripes TaxID=182062 RepID=A0A8H5LUQ1_9AGAR|nr:hypothetical protein D9758_001020 [Tetrapyrgos nigripes]
MKRKAGAALRQPPAKRATRSSAAQNDPDPSHSDDQLDCIPTTRRSTKRVQFHPPALPSPPRPEPSPVKPQATIKRPSRASPKKPAQLETPSLTPPPRPASPTKKALAHLPPHLHESLDRQKSAILQNLHSPALIHDYDEEDEEQDAPANLLAAQHVGDLLKGTTERGEGNSCLLLGPRASGKTKVIEQCISELSQEPIVVHLSGWIHHNDRLAMREIAYQLNQQTSASFLPEGLEVDGDAENPFMDDTVSGLDSIPTAHLHALISCIPTLPRPTIVILDGFDLFTLHPRQSLLYSLLDTVQSLRMGPGIKGLAVVGLTSRMDTINLLEKRVKSRFSGRMIRTAPPRKPAEWTHTARAMLMPKIEVDSMDVKDEFTELWKTRVDDFLADPKIARIFEETFSVTRDLRTLSRLLIQPVLSLTPNSPWLTSEQLERSAVAQRIRPEYPELHKLTYPSLCLLVASVHAETAGYPAVTFEMLHEYICTRIRTSSSAPVQINGRSIGMVKIPRLVLLSTFEKLVSAKMFVATAAHSLTIGKEFVRYRCAIHRQDIKQAIDKSGQTNLKTWLNKAS